MSWTNRDSGYVDNLQTGQTVIDCNLHMLTTEEYSDVTFRVGSEKLVVRAHRYVLISRSCVFHSMFCGSLAEKGEVTIPDIEPDVFKAFLRYLYTDTTTLTADTVAGLLYTSRKYAVDALQEMCFTFLEKSLSEDNACQILEHCHGYGKVDLVQKALKILTEAGVKVIKSPGFLELCSNCFGQFLQSDQLNLKEEEVFEAALSWAKGKCVEKGVSLNPENLRKILGELRYEIRFSDFTLEYLVKVVGPSGLLTNDERVRIIDKSVDSNVDISPFKHGPRRKEPKVVQQKELSSHYVSRYSGGVHGGWSCSEKPQAVSFTVSRDISLVGCQLYGPWKSSKSIYRLNVVLKDDQNHVIAEPVPSVNGELIGMEELNDVMFPDPVPLVAGLTYIICVTMRGDYSYYGAGGQSSVTTDGVKFTFSDLKYSTKYSKCSKGQIPGLIWRY